jgi:hypothetical protein
MSATGTKEGSAAALDPSDVAGNSLRSRPVAPRRPVLSAGSCRHRFVSAHDAGVVARFQGDNETRLVYARHKDEPDAPLFFLAQGRAGENGLRDFVRERLECPMPTCEDRRLSLVHRSASHRPKRDGFAHQPGARRHSPESIWHLTGKEMVARWVAARRPNAKVDLETRLGDGDRVADVLMQWPVRKLALEVQYSSITIAQWRERHNWYRDHNIPDVWLFGHQGTHLQLAQPGNAEKAPTFRFSELHRAMIADMEAENRPAWFYWLNPEAGLLGTPYVRRTLPNRRGAWHTLPTPEDTEFSLSVEPLPHRFLLDNDLGIMSPNWWVISQADREFKKEKALVDGELAEAARLETDRRAEAERVRAEARAEADRRLAQRQAARRAALQARAEAARSRPLDKTNSERTTWTGPMAPRPPAPGKPTCRNCGSVLDPILTKFGYHFGCEPSELSDPEASVGAPDEMLF